MAKLTGPSKHHMTVIGAEMTRQREQKGWTQEEVAGKIRAASGRDSLSQQYISQLEGPGDHEVPTDVALAIDEIFS